MQRVGVHTVADTEGTLIGIGDIWVPNWGIGLYLFGTCIEKKRTYLLAFERESQGEKIHLAVGDEHRRDLRMLLFVSAQNGLSKDMIL